MTRRSTAATARPRSARSARVAASGLGAALALGAGLLGAAPAQAAEQSTASPSTATVATSTAATSTAIPAASSSAASSTSTSATASLDQLVLVRSARVPTTYYLKAAVDGGLGEVPAPSGTYAVDIASGGRQEHFVVRSQQGVLDLKDSQILQTSTFEPWVTVTWLG